MQIILNETSNLAQVVMGTVTCTTTSGANNCADVAGESVDVGFLGNSTQDFKLRSVTNGTNTWATSVAGIVINAVCNMSSTNFPTSGQTYSWTPLPPVPLSFVSCTATFINNLGSAPKGAINSKQRPPVHRIGGFLFIIVFINKARNQSAQIIKLCAKFTSLIL